MKNINSYRVFDQNELAVNEQGHYVLYWMQTARRFHFHYGLEYAIAWANKLDKPLLIYEGLNAKYPWNSERTTRFILEGMAEHQSYAQKNNIPYVCYAEKNEGDGKGIVYALAEKAALVISDEYPVYMNRSLNERVKQRLETKFITIDSNGIIPLGITDKAPYSAYLFRKTMQKYFGEAISHFPKEDPLSDLKHVLPFKELRLETELLERLEDSMSQIKEPEHFAATLEYDYKVKPIEHKGNRSYGLDVMRHFISKRLGRYHTHRNHPDTPTASQLSPWLHFGKISVFEVVNHILDTDPEWKPTKLTPNNGKNAGYFNLSEAVESFFDEIITWREVGFHFAHHTPNYDQFESLPDWALKTMSEHAHDERTHVYTFEQLANAQTHDPIWNAAQRQLKEEGIIHNYLRMLWGKKVIEWSVDYQTALKHLIDLNNIYAIDGRDPNSYSGIFWCFGRFDRAWTERPILGKLRYMASANTEKKIKMKGYLKKWGPQMQMLD